MRALDDLDEMVGRVNDRDGDGGLELGAQLDELLEEEDGDDGLGGDDGLDGGRVDGVLSYADGLDGGGGQHTGWRRRRWWPEDGVC